MPLTVFAPIDGAVVPLEQVPDPVFSERMLGDGVALDPAGDTIYAPIDGKIINFNKALHALVIAQNGIEILIHVGLETVSLKGEGFTPLVKEGETVKKGQPLLKFSHTALAKAASSLIMLVVTAPADTKVQGTAPEITKTGEPLFQVCVSGEQTTANLSQTFTQGGPFTVLNANGLHARPAGVLARLAAAYAYPVQICCGDKSTDAKSVVGIMGLALEYNSQVTVKAGGPTGEAKTFLTQVEKAFQNAFGEKGANLSIPTENKKTPLDFSAGAEVSGLCACGGLANGQAFLFKPADAQYEENATNPQEELKALSAALEAETVETQAKIAAEPHKTSQDILAAHLALLQDPLMHQTALEAVSRGKTASYAVNEAVRTSIDILKKTKNRFLMERIADIKDLRRSLLWRLSGQKYALPKLPKGCILIAEELLPSDVSHLAGLAAGVLLAHGSPTAHAGILLRNMGLPAIVNAGEDILQIPSGAPVLLYADEGKAVINPTKEQLKDFAATNQKEQALLQEASTQAQEPALTSDGVHISVQGNVSSPQEAALAVQHGAEGLGLVRTEFLFNNRADAPGETEQQAVYQETLNACRDMPATFRLLDAGGDKPLPFVNILPEDNPIVGVRGIRAFKRNEDFFRTQIRAVLQTAPLNQVRIMLPMVTFAEEIIFFKKLIAQEAEQLGIKEQVQIGAMIEVPSAALASGQLARHADFFSIGTNDLTQYTLAIDRGHKELSAQADPLHPAVLKLISLTSQGAKKYNRPVAVCGAMAGDLAAVPFLIGLGVSELAVGVKNIAQVKALIRRVSHKKCEELAAQALELTSAQEVRALGRKYIALS